MRTEAGSSAKSGTSPTLEACSVSVSYNDPSETRFFFSQDVLLIERGTYQTPSTNPKIVHHEKSPKAFNWETKPNTNLQTKYETWFFTLRDLNKNFPGKDVATLIEDKTFKYFRRSDNPIANRITDFYKVDDMEYHKILDSNTLSVFFNKSVWLQYYIKNSELESKTPKEYGPHKKFTIQNPNIGDRIYVLESSAKNYDESEPTPLDMVQQQFLEIVKHNKGTSTNQPATSVEWKEADSRDVPKLSQTWFSCLPSCYCSSSSLLQTKSYNIATNSTSMTYSSFLSNKLNYSDSDSSFCIVYNYINSSSSTNMGIVFLLGPLLIVIVIIAILKYYYVKTIRKKLNNHSTATDSATRSVTDTVGGPYEEEFLDELQEEKKNWYTVPTSETSNSNSKWWPYAEEGKLKEVTVKIEVVSSESEEED